MSFLSHGILGIRFCLKETSIFQEIIVKINILSHYALKMGSFFHFPEPAATANTAKLLNKLLKY